MTEQPKRECRLCGYLSTEYQVLAVPLSSPPQDNAICSDCVEDLMVTKEEPTKASKEMKSAWLRDLRKMRDMLDDIEVKLEIDADEALIDADIRLLRFSLWTFSRKD